MGDQSRKREPAKKIVMALRDRAEDRRERLETREVNRFPDWRKIDRPFIPGSFSLFIPSLKLRYLRKQGTIDLSGIAEAPTTLARDYIKVKHWRASRPRGAHQGRVLLAYGRSPAWPNYAEPSEFEDGAYLDIRSTFFSIMLVAGWDVSYSPGHYLMSGEPPRDFPFPDHRIARNSLVSCSAAKNITRIDPPQFRRTTTKAINENFNPSLSALIRDVLHAIALQAIEAGAVYANVDGFICPDQETAGVVARIIEDWGLAWSIKGAGAGEVIGPSVYQVGSKQSEWIGRRTRPGRIRSLVDLDYARWLQGAFANLAAHQ